MSISEKIKKSKDKIKYSQRLNVSCNIYNSIFELEKRKKDKDFLATIPVNIVASNESFFKEILSNLIDFDEKFLKNSKTLIKRTNVKIDIEDIFHITKSTFTLGDLIAYSFKYSSIESIYKTFTEVSNLDLFKHSEELTKIINESFELDNVINEERPIDRNRIFKNLIEVYEIRNIICHDYLSATHTLILDADKMKEYLMDTYVFQELISILLSEKIYSVKIPLEPSKCIEYYESIIIDKTKKLNNLYSEIKKDFKTEIQYKNLEKNIKQFEKFIDFESKLLTNNFTKLEIDFKPLVGMQLEYKIKLIEQRIKNLTEKINYSS